MSLWLAFLIAIVLTTIFWLLGGQFGSAWRKYGILFISLLLIAYRAIYGQIWWHYLPIPAFCAVLFLGYGEKSWFMKVLKNEELVRIADAIAIAIPLLITAWLSSKLYINYFIITISLLSAFQIRGGGIKIGKKDLLFVDVARGLAVGIALTQAV
jgi:hypothetical protein